jgi:hypothetical protein
MVWARWHKASFTPARGGLCWPTRRPHAPKGSQGSLCAEKLDSEKHPYVTRLYRVLPADKDLADTKTRFPQELRLAAHFTSDNQHGRSASHARARFGFGPVPSE